MNERDVRLKFRERKSWRVCGEQALRNIMTVDGGSAHVMRTSGQIFLGEHDASGQLPPIVPPAVRAVMHCKTSAHEPLFSPNIPHRLLARSDFAAAPSFGCFGCSSPRTNQRPSRSKAPSASFHCEPILPTSMNRRRRRCIGSGNY